MEAGSRTGEINRRVCSFPCTGGFPLCSSSSCTPREKPSFWIVVLTQKGGGKFLSFLPFALFIAPRSLPPFNPFSERPSDAPEPRRLLQTPPPPFILSALEAPDKKKFEGRPEEWVLLAISIAGSEAGGIELPDGDDYWAEQGEIAAKTFWSLDSGNSLQAAFSFISILLPASIGNVFRAFFWQCKKQ